MDGWMYSMDVCMDVCMDGWMMDQEYGWMNGWMYSMYGWLDGWSTSLHESEKSFDLPFSRNRNTVNETKTFCFNQNEQTLESCSTAVCIICKHRGDYSKRHSKRTDSYPKLMHRK